LRVKPFIDELRNAVGLNACKFVGNSKFETTSTSVTPDDLQVRYCGFTYLKLTVHKSAAKNIFQTHSLSGHSSDYGQLEMEAFFSPQTITLTTSTSVQANNHPSRDCGHSRPAETNAELKTS
jgi:hypothetical protein